MRLKPSLLVLCAVALGALLLGGCDTTGIYTGYGSYYGAGGYGVYGGGTYGGYSYYGPEYYVPNRIYGPNYYGPGYTYFNPGSYGGIYFPYGYYARRGVHGHPPRPRNDFHNRRNYNRNNDAWRRQQPNYNDRNHRNDFNNRRYHSNDFNDRRDNRNRDRNRSSFKPPARAHPHHKRAKPHQAKRAPTNARPLNPRVPAAGSVKPYDSKQNDGRPRPCTPRAPGAC